MSHKITDTELIELLSARLNLSEAITDGFLKTYIGVICEGLAEDGIVKITGLGTFKLQKLESRKIVNIQTGKEQIIPAHYKVAFTPDKDLAFRLNEPFAHLTTIDLDEEELKEEPIEPIAAAAREYFDEEIHEIPLPIDIDTTHMQVESPINYTIETNKESSDQNDASQEVGSSYKEKYVDMPSPEEVKNYPAKEHKGYMVASVLLLLVAIGLFTLFYIRISSLKSDKNAPKAVISENIVTTPSPLVIDSVISDKKLEKEIKLTDTPTTSVEPVLSDKKYEPIAQESIRYGSRLTLLAQKYYGNKHFWCYIFEENKSEIQNPNQIPIGTVLVIPDPRKYDIDARSAESVAKAKQYTDELNGRYK